ncbi:nitrate reductase cytochrome c-type subunit [Oceanithermus sp.]
MKEMKTLVLLLGLFVVVVAGLIAYTTTKKNAEAQTAPAVTATETVAQPAQTEPATDTGTAGTVGGIRTTDPLQSGSEELPLPSENAPAPGAAERLPRAYENAPPQIPHSIDGLVPITLSNNACLSCHVPEVAPSVGATPLPPTHLQMDLFSESEGKKVPVDPSRYNCTQCHVPQAGVNPPVANEFQPDFRNPEAQNKSTLYDQWNEGVQ